MDFGWGRARPTLCIRDPKKAERLATIEAAVSNHTPRTAVFFVDEVEIDLNPCIGFAQSRGR